MGIDASIYSNIKPIQSPDMFETYGKALTLKNLARQDALHQQEADESQAIKQSFAKNTDQNGNLNRSVFLSDLGKINPLKQMQYQQSFLKNDSEGLENKAKTLELQMNQLGAAAQLAMSAKDQKSYEENKKRGAEMGLDISQLPQQFDKNLLNGIAFNSIKQSERIAAEKLKIDEILTRSQVAKNYAEANKKDNPKEKDPTQSQFAAATYGTRASQAEDVFKNLSTIGFDPTSKKSAIERNLPGFMEGFKGENVKRQEQAERNFVNSVLRRESGSAISKEEFANAEQQYFPRLGDTPEVLKQKENNRRTVMASLMAEGGPAVSRIDESISKIPDNQNRSKNSSSISIIPSAEASSVPKIKHGHREDGYIFLGGDPSNPKSWKKEK